MTDLALAEAIRHLVLNGLHEGARGMEHVHAEAGYEAAMRQEAQKLMALTESRYVQAILIARLFAHAQETVLALDWLWMWIGTTSARNRGSLICCKESV